MVSEGKILITGCSSGIGRATALFLARQGMSVLATARRLESLEGLKNYSNITLAQLDVTSEEQCEQVVQEAGVITGLVNNAGYGMMGPSEEVARRGLREQFETNFFGLARLCALVLPQMRARGRGVIVNVGSIMGKLTAPMCGAYCASKYAVEAFCDTLRIEVAPFGVKVVLIEPGPIDTKFKANVELKSLEALKDETSPYFDMARKALRFYQHQGWPGASPDRVARTIAKVLTRAHPRPRYVVTNRGRMAILFHQMVPDRIWDFLISKSFGLR
ncbi:MAG: SDR family oxidoreductase [Verrucomicrobiae bacterium]|nr:SDR family oxidoreductase [Verrucomicrobiae bacterium]